MLNLTLLIAAVLCGFTSGETLSVDKYLTQVEQSNPGYRGKKESSAASLVTAQEGALVYSPQFYSNVQYVYDTRRKLIPAIEGTTNEKMVGEVGLRKQLDFGLQLQLSFNINHTTFFGADPAIVTDPSRTIFWVTPVFNLSLWQNIGGRMDRANARLAEARAKAESYGSGYEAKATLVEAESRYWKLAALREASRLIEASVDRAVAIRTLHESKLKRGLLNASDLLISQSAVRGKQLELSSIRDEELTAAQHFNAARGLNSHEVPEALLFPDPSALRALSPPTKSGARGDTRASEQANLAAVAGSEVAREKLSPTLNLYGSIYAVGFVFALPLEFDRFAAMRDAYSQQGAASDLIHRKKVMDEQNEWNDLVRRFDNAKERLEIAIDLERIQREKSEGVQKRLKNGLTIADQVFQYELDYLSSSLNRVQLQGLILGLRAQMKLYEGM